MQYSSFDSFVLRKPLCSVEEFTNIVSKVDSSTTCEAIKCFFNDSRNAMALYLASPDLYTRFQEIKEKSGAITNFDIYKSLYKYMARMTNRSTPFGMFSGSAVGNISTDLNLKASKVKPSFRFDMNYLFLLFKELTKNKSVRYSLTYFPNNSMYQVGTKTRYLERRFDGTIFSYFISEFENHEFTDDFFNHIKNGKSFKEILDFFVSLGFDIDEVENYINELIDNEIIVDSFYPTVYGNLYENKLLEVINQIELDSILTLGEKKIQYSRFKEIYYHVLNKLRLLENKGVSSHISDFEDIFSSLDELGIAYNKNRIIQCDLFYDEPNLTIDTNILKQIRKCINVVATICSNNNRNIDRLESFKKRFFELFEFEEVLLLKVIDSDYGIGYGYSEKSHESNESGRLSRLLLDKILNARECGENEITIEDNDLKDFEFNIDNVAPTFAAMFSIMRDNSNNIVLDFQQTIGLASAASIIGRFTHGSTQTNRLAVEIAKKEEELFGSDVILAELHHITESRTGNILSRKAFRSFEIPFLASSNGKNDEIINLDDIYISISRRDKRIILRSKKLGKEILPMFSHAHNYYAGSTQPLYQFFGDLQFQNYNQTIGFNWGKIKGYINRLPRVVYKNHIISRAKWRIDNSLRDEIKGKSFEAQIKHIQTWCIKNHVPSVINIVSDDIKLPIHLKNQLSLKIFIDEVIRSNELTLEENPSYSFDSVVQNFDKSKTAHEVLVFYAKQHKIKESKSTTKSPVNISNNYKSQRYFFPGSEWIYYKIYCGEKAAQAILSFVNQEFAYKELGNDFFFIRYTDPEFHIRLRFRIKNEKDRGGFMMLFYNKLIEFNNDNDLFSRLIVDTYARELERYHPALIEIAENIFINNSKFVLSVLDKSFDYNDLQLISLKYVDIILDELDFDLDHKSEFAMKHSLSYRKEFETNRSHSKNVGQLYAKLKSHIDDSMTHKDFDFFGLKNVQNNLIELKSLLEMVTQACNNSTESISIELFASSIIHMFSNRLFVSKQRYEEMITYDIITKYYKKKTVQLQMDSNHFNSANS